MNKRVELPFAQLARGLYRLYRERVLAARSNQGVRWSVRHSSANLVGNLADLPVGGPDLSAPASFAEPAARAILAARRRLGTGWCASKGRLLGERAERCGTDAFDPGPTCEAAELSPAEWCTAW